VTLFAADYPPWEFLIFAVALLIGLIGKIVEFSRKIREKSIEAEQREERQFGADLEEAPEPQRDELPVRLALVRRPLPPREPAPPSGPTIAGPVRAPHPPPTMTQPRARPEHAIMRLLRQPHGARNAVILAEILGPPKALRRGR
jgi:hypothetical protein